MFIMGSPSTFIYIDFFIHFKILEIHLKSGYSTV